MLKVDCVSFIKLNTKIMTSPVWVHSDSNSGCSDGFVCFVDIHRVISGL